MMWNTGGPPNARAIQKRKRLAAAQASKTGGNMHLQRALVELRYFDSEKNISCQTTGRVILSEIQEAGMAVYCNEALPSKCELEATLIGEKDYKIRGYVISSQNMNLDRRIISETPFSFRTLIKFIVESEQEQSLIQEFCRELGLPNEGSDPKAA